MRQDDTILEAVRLNVHFPGPSSFFGRKSAPVRAVSDVSLRVRKREILGLVGESGCGKTTLARTLLGIQRETGGDVMLDGKNLSGLRPREARFARRDIQYVHQDAAAVLDPWWSVGATLTECLVIHGQTGRGEHQRQVDEILQAVGLDPTVKRRYVHELSGGQLRRVTLARILLLRPSILILDEPTAGLDMSVQALVLKLLMDLRERFNLTYVFISHDLSVVERLCDRVAIMYLGRIVEIGQASTIFSAPAHPYTRALLAAAPRLDPEDGKEAAALEGDPPSVRNPPPGCSFHTRCFMAREHCLKERPELMQTDEENREAACFRWQEMLGGTLQPSPVGVEDYKASS